MIKNEILASVKPTQFKKRDTIVGYEGLLKSIALKDKEKENDSTTFPNI
jgi:hypothetical protein